MTGHAFAFHQLLAKRVVHARELFSRSERGSDIRGYPSALVEDSLQTIAEDPELTEGRVDRDGQEDELVARLLRALVLQCWSSFS